MRINVAFNTVATNAVTGGCYPHGNGSGLGRFNITRRFIVGFVERPKFGFCDCGIFATRRVIRERRCFFSVRVRVISARLNRYLDIRRGIPSFAIFPMGGGRGGGIGFQRRSALCHMRQAFPTRGPSVRLRTAHPYATPVGNHKCEEPFKASGVCI